MVSLEKEEWCEEIYSQLYKVLEEKASFTEVLEPRAAIQGLSATPRPDAVLVSDAAITSRENLDLLTVLVAYAREGGVVVLGMQFSNHLPLDGRSRAFFTRWGLPRWSPGSYHRTTFVPNPAGVPAPLDVHALLPSYSMKAVHIKGAAHGDAVYLPTASSRVESHVFAPSRITGAQESPALFARVGQGHLGYAGDVNGEQGTTRLLLEMCGVKVKPGDMGSRTYSTGITFSQGRVSAQNATDDEIPLPPRPPAPRPRESEVTARRATREGVKAQKTEKADALKNEVLLYYHSWIRS